MSFLNSIYSRKIIGEKIIYRIFGIKISKRNNGLNIQKFNLIKMRKNIINKILSSKTQYVSFDIFDTLLVRPCINPKDIFVLLAQKYNSKYNIDFLNMRINAENDCKISNANIYEIYNFIQKKYNLSDEIKTILLNEEIELEYNLLSVRQDTKEFYDTALNNGKKIIAVSDMYLPANILDKILKKNGFNNIQKIYVSNEYKARKDDGELYDIVINDLQTNKILHIGDNYNSDYISPLKKNISAVFYPKTTEIFRSCNKLFNKLICSCFSIYNSDEQLNKNIFLGFIVNNYLFNKNTYNSKIFNSISDFVNLFLAPYLFYITFRIQYNPIIQNSYDEIYFASRDGFLPNKVYSLLNQNTVRGGVISFLQNIYTVQGLPTGRGFIILLKTC